MSFPLVKCPTCGELPIATSETIPGCLAFLEKCDDKGKKTLEYSGETRVNWDGQEADRDIHGRAIFYCDKCERDFAADIGDSKIFAESPIRARFMHDDAEVLRHARAMIRDLFHGWPVKELGGDPKEVCEKLSRLLGETYDFNVGDVEDVAKKTPKAKKTARGRK